MMVIMKIGLATIVFVLVTYFSYVVGTSHEFAEVIHEDRT